MKLLEKSRNELVAKSKKDSKGLQRYKRRLKSHVASSVKQFNRIDMNEFFTQDILTVNIEVRGETDNYIVSISFGGVLDELHRELERNNNTLELRNIIRAIVNSFNRNDVYVKCTCPDFCLEENTKIKLLNGESIPIKEMFDRFTNNEELWVYSTDTNGDFKPGRVSDVWISGYVNDMIKVTLDNGESIITTPNHKYMLRDGSYKEAKDLVIDQSLMPMYFNYHDGYESFKQNSIIDKTIFKSVYKEVANTLLTNQIENAKSRSGETNIQIHHKDFNKLNNFPSNLVPLGKQEHWKYHYTHLHESGNYDKWQKGSKDYWATKEARDKQSIVAKEIFTKYYSKHSSEDISALRKSLGCYSEEWKSKIGESNKAVWDNYSEEAYVNRCNINRMTNNRLDVKAKIAEGQRQSYINNPERKNISRQNLLKAVEAVKGKPFSENHRSKIRQARLSESPEQKYNHSRKIAFSKIGKVFEYMIAHCYNLDLENYTNSIAEIKLNNKHLSIPSYLKYFKDFAEMINYFNLNHKVKFIEYLHYENSIPVYDLTVDNYNNFLTSAGVVLHNCYRFGYWSTINKYKNGEAELRPSNITNPDDNLGSACKHILLVLSNTSWIIKVARVIQNYIEYMKLHREQQYAKTIYPAIYDKPYEKDIQANMFGDKLDSEQSDIDAANKQAREKGQFKQGNPYRYEKQPNKDQISIDDEIELEGEDGIK